MKRHKRATKFVQLKIWVKLCKKIDNLTQIVQTTREIWLVLRRRAVPSGLLNRFIEIQRRSVNNVTVSCLCQQSQKPFKRNNLFSKILGLNLMWKVHSHFFIRFLERKAMGICKLTTFFYIWSNGLRTWVSVVILGTVIWGIHAVVAMLATGQHEHTGSGEKKSTPLD